MKLMVDRKPKHRGDQGSSPASRGGSGVYIEGELGAFYLLAMLAGVPAHGMPLARIVSVRFQGTDLGYALDDLVIQGASRAGDTILEIQSKRDITFAPKDAVYRDVAGQIARSSSDTVPEERHFLGIATQRTSRKISGAYQDVLKWAAAAETSEQFYHRLTAKGVANDDMREFVSTTRKNLVAGEATDSDEATWRFLRRMLILEFDFESSTPLARTHALMLARQVLADEDAERAEALWSNLIEISIETGTTGGSLDLVDLRTRLADFGYRLAGDRDYAPARARLAEMAQMTVEAIGATVAGINLQRIDRVEALDEAREAHRFIEIRGGPGVGKSWVLRNAAERTIRQAPIIVLDPIATPGGGWIAFAQSLGIPGTANAFLVDLAASGGATIFIDGLDMIVDPGRQRTVSELLRAASRIPGFTVIATARTGDSVDSDLWLDAGIVDGFGGSHIVEVGELTDAEAGVLTSQAPQLGALLDGGHPAAKLARNLYRLSRLLKTPSATQIRTEAALSSVWWKCADGAAAADIRAAQRILADLAAQALNGGSGIELSSDSSARSHLLQSLTLREIRRDQVDFYHDVLRDWAIGNIIVEQPARLDAFDLSTPVSPRLARGIELAGRLALETEPDCGLWTDLLHHLAPAGAHSSWRRHALLALVRSEAGLELLEKCSADLLSGGGALLSELVIAISAMETVATVDIIQMPDGGKLDLPRSYRTNTTGSAIWVLRLLLNHVSEIPLQAIGVVVELVEIQLYLLKQVPALAKPTAMMLFGWLRQLDVRDAVVTIPSEAEASRRDRSERGRLIDDLRSMALILSNHAPDQLKAYLSELAAERDHYKVKDIRLLSSVVAPVAPAEFARLIEASLLNKRERRRSSSIDRAFTLADSDYMPPSPAQPPFLDLLEAAPEEGLRLVRALVAEALAHHVEGHEAGEDGFSLVFPEGPRFFPWTDTYLWSRDQAREYSAASGLKALEAWSHNRLDAGEPVAAVVADILGPEGSCAAYLLVAVDVLLSHFQDAREALVPFVACPELLAADRQRSVHEQVGGMASLFGEREPKCRITLADLAARPSRRMDLQSVMTAYLGDDPSGNTLRQLLAAAVAKLGPYPPYATWVDARFVGRHAVNLLNLENWVEVEGGKLMYQAPGDEAAHVAHMETRRAESVTRSEIEARISLALEGGDYATADTARLAIEYADGALPDDSDTDALQMRSTRLITTALLVARDGDGPLLEAHETWVRQVIALGLAEGEDSRSGHKERLRFNRPAIATLALVHLWLRAGAKADRDALIELATRRDGSAALAFASALARILETDGRVFKAAMREAYAGCLRRWHSYGEDDGAQERFESARDEIVRRAVAAEIAWLDGAGEPQWPTWPNERPLLRRALRIRVPGPADALDEEEGGDDDDDRGPSNLHVDSHLAAQWLAMVNAAPKGSLDWAQQIVETYSAWTTKMNGLGLPADAEVDREPADWNLQYYALVAQQLMDAPSDSFEAELRLVTGLPEESFGDVAQTLIHAADALYFNDPQRPAERPAALRLRMAERIAALRRWNYVRDPASQSVDSQLAGVVAKFFLNTHNPFAGTNSYLPTALSDRLDPLLPAMRSLLPGGPTSFVALCVMNLLMVTPRVRHLDFLLDACDAWFDRAPIPEFWAAAGIGRRVVDWVKAAFEQDSALLAAAHPERHRIDRLLGRLVQAGVAEAHELELAIELAISKA